MVRSQRLRIPIAAVVISLIGLAVPETATQSGWHKEGRDPASKDSLPFDSG